MKTVKTVTVLGANGTIGSLCSGLIAGFGSAKVYLVARTIAKAKEGKARAMDSIKSESIKNQLIPKTYQNLKECLSKSNWILEAVSEDFALKQKLNNLITKYKRPGTIVSTTTSGLSITRLAKSFSPQEQKYYFGTHFFNPPYKMVLCEFITNPNSDPKVQQFLSNYLSNVLHRQLVITSDTPAFAGNRIGFLILNQAAQFAARYQDKGGIAYIDHLLGGLSGRALPPLKTIDLVGLDTHQAIVDNLHFKTPLFIKQLIRHGQLGDKTHQGLYQGELVFNIQKQNYQSISKFDYDFLAQAKSKIADGQYSAAVKILLQTSGSEAKIIQYFFARYISYSLSLVGPVVKSKEDVDKVMAYGFNWLPPCALVDLIGIRATLKLIKKFKLTVPPILSKVSPSITLYSLQNQLDFRSFLRAN